MNQSAIIINIKPLYEILNEINNNFSYELVHFNTKEFEENFNKDDKKFENSNGWRLSWMRIFKNNS